MVYPSNYRSLPFDCLLLLLGNVNCHTRNVGLEIPLHFSSDHVQEFEGPVGIRAFFLRLVYVFAGAIREALDRIDQALHLILQSVYLHLQTIDLRLQISDRHLVLDQLGNLVIPSQNFDSVPTTGLSKLMTSDSIYTAIVNAVAGVPMDNDAMFQPLITSSSVLSAKSLTLSGVRVLASQVVQKP